MRKSEKKRENIEALYERLKIYNQAVRGKSISDKISDDACLRACILYFVENTAKKTCHTKILVRH